MRSVLQVMWANITHKKGAFKGIIALVAILTMSFSVSLSNDDNTHRAISEGFERAELGDFVISIMSDLATKEMYEKLDKSEDILTYKVDKRLVFREKKEVNGKYKNNPGTLCKNNGKVRFFDEYDNIVTDNVKINEGEIYLTYKMKKDPDFKVGNTIRMCTKNGYDEQFVIKGFFEDPLFGSILFSMNNALISDEDFERLYSEKKESYTDNLPCVYSTDYLFVNAKDGADHSKIRNRINDICGSDKYSNYTYEEKVVRMYNALVADTGPKVMQYSASYCLWYNSLIADTVTKTVFIFAILLFIIIMITINDNIISSVEMDYKTLGILKANGFTSGKIRMIFIYQYILAVFIGSIIGMLASVPLIGILCRHFMRITCVFTENSLSLEKCICVSMAVIALCIISIVKATSRIGKISPVRAISCRKNDIYFDSRMNVHIHRKTLGLFVAFRQITSNITSYLGCTIIASLLVFFMSSIMAMTKGLDTKSIFLPLKYDLTARICDDFEDEDIKTIRDAVHEKDNGANIDFSVGINVTIEGKQCYCDIRNGDTIRFKPIDGRLPKYENEIFITKLLAGELGKNIGDTVTVSSKDNSGEFIITGFFQTVYERGMATEITLSGGKRLGKEYPVYSNITLSNKNKTEEMIDYLNDSFKGKITASKAENDTSLEDIMKIIDLLFSMLSTTMYFKCVLFAAVVVQMVCAKTFQRERKDLCIYKALGMSSSQLRLQFAIKFTIIAFVGSFMGCLITVLTAKKILSLLMRIIGLTNFLSDFRPYMFIIPSGAMILSFFVFSYLASSRIKNVEVRELITE